MFDQIQLCVATAVGTAIVMFIGLNRSLGERQIDAPLTRLYAIKDPQFLRAICSVMTPAVVSGNRVEELINGDEIFPAMLEAVGEAKESIGSETYIYWSGSIGAEFSRTFSAAARRGLFSQSSSPRNSSFT